MEETPRFSQHIDVVVVVVMVERLILAFAVGATIDAGNVAVVESGYHHSS